MKGSRIFSCTMQSQLICPRHSQGCISE